MNTLYALTIATLLGASLPARQTVAEPEGPTFDTSAAARVRQIHGQLPAGPQTTATAALWGTPGTTAQVFLSHDGHAKDYVLGQQVIPTGGSIGWAPVFLPDRPRLYLCTEADRAVDGCALTPH